MNFLKCSLLILCLVVSSCSKREIGKATEKRVPPVEYQLTTDDRFFSKPVRFPTGEVTNEQRESFAQELESALDGAKVKFEVIAIRAEAPHRTVIALYARDLTREECESVVQSEVIQRAAAIGFRTFSCEDRANNLLFSTPIKDSRGELRITQDEQGELQVVPVR